MAETNGKRRTTRGKPMEDERLFSPPDVQERTFTHTDPWRVLRIMGEFVEGFDTLAEIGRAVALFGSARVPPESPIFAQAQEVGRLLGESGLTIITGGGPGLMEAGNRGAREAGAPSVGLGIELPFEHGVNSYVDTGIEFRYFFVRKTMFLKYAQAFVIFPGGFGTMDELFEALTLIQTGKVRNLPVILFGVSYWQGLIEWIRTTMLAHGMVSPSDIDLIAITDSPEDVRDRVLAALQAADTRQHEEAQSREATEAAIQRARRTS